MAQCRPCACQPQLLHPQSQVEPSASTTRETVRLPEDTCAGSAVVHRRHRRIAAVFILNTHDPAEIKWKTEAGLQKRPIASRSRLQRGGSASRCASLALARAGAARLCTRERDARLGRCSEIQRDEHRCEHRRNPARPHPDFTSFRACAVPELRRGMGTRSCHNTGLRPLRRGCRHPMPASTRRQRGRLLRPGSTCRRAGSADTLPGRRWRRSSPGAPTRS